MFNVLLINSLIGGLFVIILAKEQVNIALHKPAFQSSPWWGPEQWTPDLAVDGNTGNHLVDNSCTTTAQEPNPWRAVDLQQSMRIDRVVLYKRGDCDALCANRLSNIHIGTTDVSPSVAAPTLDSISVCARDDAPMVMGEVRPFCCGGTGRYLVVFLNKPNGEYLTLCEVEVFGGPADQPLPPTKLRPTSQMSRCFLASLTSAKRLEMNACMNACMQDACCQAVDVITCELSYLRTEKLHFVKEY